VTTIERISLSPIDLEPQVRRSDAIQSIQCQETPIVTLTVVTGCPVPAIGTRSVRADRR